jgi:hypothetical protein
MLNVDRKVARKFVDTEGTRMLKEREREEKLTSICFC